MFDITMRIDRPIGGDKRLRLLMDFNFAKGHGAGRRVEIQLVIPIACRHGYRIAPQRGDGRVRGGDDWIGIRRDHADEPGICGFPRILPCGAEMIGIAHSDQPQAMRLCQSDCQICGLAHGELPHGGMRIDEQRGSFAAHDAWTCVRIDDPMPDFRVIHGHSLCAV